MSRGIMCLGKVDREAVMERAKLFASSIIAFTETDHATRIWWGTGNGCDVLQAEVTDKLGQRWIMGRLREAVDDKLFGSNDVKSPVWIVAPAGMDAKTWELAVDLSLSAAEAALGKRPTETRCDVRDPLKFADVIGEAVASSGNGRFAKATYEAGDVGNVKTDAKTVQED